MAGCIDAVLFDLGHTLVAYYTREQFPAILNQGLEGVSQCLRENGLLRVGLESVIQAGPTENYENKDSQFRPLIGRLRRLFELNNAEIPADLEIALCRCFLKPVFAVAHVYEDTLPALARLRSSGYRTGIVSNSPWGTPASLWREELDRLGLSDAVDTSIFCGDVGVRKPHRKIFDHTANLLGVSPEQCVFVGDHPVWDVEGARGAGMDALLITRDGHPEPPAIGNLCQLLEYLGEK